MPTKALISHLWQEMEAKAVLKTTGVLKACPQTHPEPLGKGWETYRFEEISVLPLADQ